MPWFIIIILVLLLTFSVKIYKFLFPFAFAIEQILSLLMKPVDFLLNLILRRESRIPGARIFRIVIMGVVVPTSIVYIVSTLSSGLTIDDIRDTMLGSTSLGQLFGFFGEERFGSSLKSQFGYTALVSMGLSSFISFLYMRCTIETISDFGISSVLNFLLVVVFNLAFICISAMLSEQIEMICFETADWVQNAKMSLTELYHSGMHGLLNILKVIFSGFLLLIMFLAGLYLLVLTAREVVASITYGFMSLLLTLVVGTFWVLIPEIFPAAPLWIHKGCVILLNITLPIAMFLPDYIRATDAIKNYLINEFKTY